MTIEEAGRVVGWLNAAFPRDALEPESFAVWVSEVADLPHPAAAMDAAKTIGRNGDRFPSVKEFRTAYRQAFDRHVAGHELEAPDATEPPPQTVRDWIATKIGPSKSGGICKTIADLPVSTATRERPVYARAKRRQSMKDTVERSGIPLRDSHAGEPVMFPPTEAEIQDAIEVLADTRDADNYFGDLLHVEATRILDGLGLS